MMGVINFPQISQITQIFLVALFRYSLYPEPGSDHFLQNLLSSGASLPEKVL